MRAKIQFGAVPLAAAMCVLLAGQSWAQKPHNNDRPPQAQSRPQAHSAPARPQNQNTSRPPASSGRAYENQNRSLNRPPAVNETPRTNFRNETAPRNEGNLRRQPETGASRPWVDQMRSLTPSQRERVLQNSRAFQNLSPDKQGKIRQQLNQWDRMSPGQRADLRAKEDTWRNLRPEQREHIKNNVLPKMSQMPWDRQQAINRKLGQLQNMPESARNQRLNDPNFTRGMNEEEQSVLRDLSHTHVGGAPETPPE